MAWDSDCGEVAALLDQAREQPWAEAWRMTLAARGDYGLANQADGLLTCARRRDWTPRYRRASDVRERLLVLAHLSSAIGALGDGDPVGFRGAVGRFHAMEVPTERLEHPELALVAAVVQQKLPARGVQVQISWRGFAAGALAWALGGFDDLDEAEEAGGELSHSLDGAPPQRQFVFEQLRPLAQVRGVLDTLRAELSSCEAPDRRDVLIEQVKALRWLTEPWWPELAVVPWRPCQGSRSGNRW